MKPFLLISALAAGCAPTGYYVANVPLCANNLSGCTGNHMATAPSGFGIQVYGYGQYTSYWYPGGLNLDKIIE